LSRLKTLFWLFMCWGKYFALTGAR
jgi:hypothetical protein